MADAPTAEGAEAFARYWIDVLNVAFATLDPGQLQAMSEPTCKTCSNYAGSLRASARDGEVYEGGRYRVLSVVSAPVAGRSARVLLTYSTPNLVVRNRPWTSSTPYRAANGRPSLSTSSDAMKAGG